MWCGDRILQTLYPMLLAHVHGAPQHAWPTPVAHLCPVALLNDALKWRQAPYLDGVVDARRQKAVLVPRVEVLAGGHGAGCGGRASGVTRPTQRTGRGQRRGKKAIKARRHHGNWQLAGITWHHGRTTGLATAEEVSQFVQPGNRLGKLPRRRRGPRPLQKIAARPGPSESRYPRRNIVYSPRYARKRPYPKILRFTSPSYMPTSTLTLPISPHTFT